MNDNVQGLERLKTRLIEYGWRKGAFGPKRGPNCMLGAMGLVANERLVPAIHAALVARGRERNIPSFNDYYAKGLNDVLALIDEAILIEKEAHVQADHSTDGALVRSRMKDHPVR